MQSTDISLAEVRKHRGPSGQGYSSNSVIPGTSTSEHSERGNSRACPPGLESLVWSRVIALVPARHQAGGMDYSAPPFQLKGEEIESQRCLVGQDHLADRHRSLEPMSSESGDGTFH